MTHSNNPESVIKNGFLSLLDEGGYQSLTIANLAKRVGMSRSNVYRYFASKREIFNAICDDLFDEFYDEMEHDLAESTDFELRAIVERIFVTLGSNAHQLKLLISCNENDMFYLRCRQYIRRLLGHYFVASNTTIRDPEFVSLITEHISGSLYHVFVAWLDGGMRYSPLQLAEMHAAMLDLKALEKGLAQQGRKFKTSEVDSSHN